MRILFFTMLILNSIYSTARESGKIIGSGTDPINITLNQPKGGWTQDRMITVAGQISDHSLNPVTVNINGDRYYLGTRGGNFSRSFPVTAGKNSISIVAKNQKGTYVKSKTLFAKIQPVPIMVVLTSDTDGVYTDLHVYEPSPKNTLNAIPTEHVFWSQTSSSSGGKFYLNQQQGSYDKPGYGPYLYTHQSPPLGIYKVDANYWPSGDKAHALASLNVVLFGGTANEQKRVVKTPLVKRGETRTLAWIKIEKNQVAHIYSPISDGEPDRAIWPDFVGRN